MSDVLAMAGVGVVRGDTVILEDVSWDVEEGSAGSCWAPTVPGKTTLLQLASARIHPTTGVVGILGEVLGAVDASAAPRIGFASASLAERIPAGERVRDVVVTASYGVVGRWREQYDRLDEGRRRAAGGAGRRPPRRPALRHAVGGERKRVQIARALMTDPELMLLDEPAAGLDLGGREDLVRRLGDLAATAPAMVLVTHHVEEVPPHFTDVLLVRDGRVVAQGPIEITLTAANLEATFGLPLEPRSGEPVCRPRPLTPQEPPARDARRRAVRTPPRGAPSPWTG